MSHIPPRLLLQLRFVVGACAVAGIVAVNADETRIPETPVLSREEYRLSLEDVVVFGQTPYWRREAQPRFEEPELQIPEKPSRLQWTPKYTREERDDWPPQDQLNPQPRAKIFELKF